jgi:hypothetical protein
MTNENPLPAALRGVTSQRVRPEVAGPMTRLRERVRGRGRESEPSGNAPSSQPSPRKRGEGVSIKPRDDVFGERQRGGQAR